MGHGDAAALTVDGAYRRQDLLSLPEPFFRVGDPGDRDVFDGQYGDDTTADVQESAEVLQSNDPAGKHASRNQVLQKERHGIFLSFPAAQKGHRRSFCVGKYAFNCKAS